MLKKLLVALFRKTIEEIITEEAQAHGEIIKQCICADCQVKIKNRLAELYGIKLEEK